MKLTSQHWQSKSVWICVLIFTLASQIQSVAIDTAELALGVVQHNERIWRERSQSAGAVSSRDLFAYALALGEAKQHPERLEPLIALAGRMQDRDPGSHSYGNFWWSLRDGKVMDFNAVDFCMSSAVLLWLKDRDFIPPPAQTSLAKLLDFSVEGCLRHKVLPSYSNIAFMNASDLILLGETLNRPTVADEGYARLDRIFQYTQTAGIHEFDSPTYTCVDLAQLGTIETFCQRDSAKNQARALLQLLWTDLALNWFPPAQRLAGAHSRTYDYLHGLGELDRLFAMNGWLPGPPSTDLDAVAMSLADWHPSPDLQKLSAQFPRLVRQSWGADWWQSRTHYLLPDITLSCTASCYGGRMDMPLTGDFSGDRKSVRGYFIADGRDDPYGQKKVADGTHQKAFHLNPFWTAAQRNGDALGLVIYRPHDLSMDTTTLVSDFVMPMEAGGFWIGDRKIDFETGQTLRERVLLGEVVAIQKGNSILGLRVPWSRGVDGHLAQTYLVYDGNSFGAVRLAVVHVKTGEHPEIHGDNPGAAFWLRIGDNLKTESDFTAWRQKFAAASATVEAKADHLSLRVDGMDGPVSVAAKAPWKSPETLEPMPTRSILELNGKDIGSKIISTGGSR